MKKILLILAIFLLAVFIFSQFKSGNLFNTNSAQYSSQTRTFQSKNLQFSILIPKTAEIKEGQTYVDIKIDQMLVDVTRNGTNFSSLEEYTKDFDAKNSVDINKMEPSIINGYNVISRQETANNTKHKIYYIFTTDGWVYTLSTSSESLYDDLDQIAQSFRYNP